MQLLRGQGFSFLSCIEQGTADSSTPKEDISPDFTLESYLRQMNKKSYKNRPLTQPDLRNHKLNKTEQPPTKPSNDTYHNLSIETTPHSSQQNENLWQTIEKINKLPIHNATFQEEIHQLLKSPNQEGQESLLKETCFPLQLAPNIRTKSKWQVCWHPKAASLIKYAYQIFHGSIDPSNPSFHLKLQEILRLLE